MYKNVISVALKSQPFKIGGAQYKNDKKNAPTPKISRLLAFIFSFLIFSRLEKC